jgi:hypothetical protein
MMSMELRPLSLGELLDRSFTLYRRHFGTFVGIMAIPSIGALSMSIFAQLLPVVAGANFSDDAPLDPSSVVWIVVWLIGLSVLGVVYVVAYMVALGATAAAVSDVYLDRAITIASAYARMTGRIGRVVLHFVLIAIRLTAVMIGTLLLVGFGVAIAGQSAPLTSFLLSGLMMTAAAVLTALLALRYALAVPALAVEDISATEALQRSISLTRNNLGRVFVLTLFAMIIVYVSVLIFQGPLMMAAVIAGPDTPLAFWLNLIGAVTGAIAGAVSGPVMIIAFAVLYYDVRIRNEGLDLQIIMRKLDPPPAASPSGVSPA